MIELGKKYKDKITGFGGVATGYVTYISGCNQVLLAPKIGKDGALKESCWIDEQRLICQGENVIELENKKSPGFDRAAPVR
jgi:hypothetical protein